MPMHDRFVVPTGVWLLMVVVYVGSIGAASLLMRFVDWGPGASALVFIAVMVLGPALLALRIGLPAAPSIAAWATVAGAYYVLLSLADNSGYDAPRWDYGHLFDGLLIMFVQAVVAVGAVVAARAWRRYRGTEFSVSASHLKYRTR